MSGWPATTRDERLQLEKVSNCIFPHPHKIVAFSTEYCAWRRARKVVDTLIKRRLITKARASGTSKPRGSRNPQAAVSKTTACGPFSFTEADWPVPEAVLKTAIPRRVWCSTHPASAQITFHLRSTL